MAVDEYGNVIPTIPEGEIGEGMLKPTNVTREGSKELGDIAETNIGIRAASDVTQRDIGYVGY